MREFGRGVGMLVRGFGWWSRHPRLMALGLVPAAIVGLVLLAAIGVLAVNLPALADVITPFADAWPSLWVAVLRIAVGTALLGGAIVLAAVSFTALTLVVGEPFYDRIWRSVERETGGTVPEGAYGFWRSVRDAASLLLRGAVAALAAALLGLVPGVGGVLSFLAGVAVSGWLLADELSSRALTGRGLDRTQRRALIRRARARTWGFGVATQLCFLVPLGAVIGMPAAVAGSTLLARSLTGEDAVTR